MRTVLKVVISFVVLIALVLAVKVGLNKYMQYRDAMAEQTQPASNTAVITTTQPTTSEPTTQATTAAAKTTLTLPKTVVTADLQECVGSPAGSTIDKPDLSNSVFIGDSVSLGFSRYCAKKSLLPETVFLTAGSYSVHYALSTDVSPNKGWKHPMYKGKETPVAQALEGIKPDNVYFCLGINDISGFGVDGTVKNYCKLINSVWAVDPEINIYIVSTTFMRADNQKKKLNNNNLANLNHNMKKICLETDRLEYIDIMSKLQDEACGLAPEYCSDGFLHENDKAYAIWIKQLVCE